GIVWNAGRTAASGGGESLVFARPRYQIGLGVPPVTARMLPDVALAANPDAPGYVMVAGGKSSGVGGTSAATPAFAGVVALGSEDLGTAGLGQLGPTLYRLGGEQARGLRAPVFHDVTQGDNGGFAAAAGFDLATGWGSPIVDALAPALAGGAAPCVSDSFCLLPGAGGPRRSCAVECVIEGTALPRRASSVPLIHHVCCDGHPVCAASGV